MTHRRTAFLAAIVMLVVGSLVALNRVREEAPKRPAPQVETVWRVNADEMYAASGYRWREAAPGESVRFAPPESDDRAFRIECSEGRIGIIGPSHADEEFESPISVTFANGDRRTGRLIELGEWPSFLVEVEPSDPLLTFLLDQDHIWIFGDEVNLNVPTGGGVALIRSLIA
ncbi:MAG: hypothetical protein ACXWU1_12280, partial [Allosphingosinicella sp.]